MTMLEFSKI